MSIDLGEAPLTSLNVLLDSVYDIAKKTANSPLAALMPDCEHEQYPSNNLDLNLENCIEGSR